MKLIIIIINMRFDFQAIQFRDFSFQMFYLKVKTHKLTLSKRNLTLFFLISNL